MNFWEGLINLDLQFIQKVPNCTKIWKSTIGGGDEKENNIIYEKICCMLASKSGIPKACGIIIAYSNFKIEMGRYYYRFFVWIT